MNRRHGYTVVELITVMVVIGIISAVAIPRLMSGASFASATYKQTIVSALRYAQKTAVGHRRLVCASFAPAAAATSVTLTIAAANPASACDTALPSPDSTPYTSTDDGVTSSGLANALFFQPDGQITFDGAGTQPATGSIAVTGQGNITVNGTNGYVE